jgi:hypothetical protein
MRVDRELAGSIYSMSESPQGVDVSKWSRKRVIARCPRQATEAVFQRNMLETRESTLAHADEFADELDPNLNLGRDKPDQLYSKSCGKLGDSKIFSLILLGEHSEDVPN